MSEPTAPLLPEPTAEPPPPEPEPPARRRNLLGWLTGAGFLIVAVALAWVWRHPFQPPVPTEATDALGRQVAALEARVARLEQQPQPQPPDLGLLAARITALEQRPQAPPQSQEPAPARTPDLGPLEAQITALAQRQPPDLKPLEARVGALESAQRTIQAEVARRLDAEDSRIAGSEKLVARTAQVQAAAQALAAGRKLGDLAGAPPALARFADADPPTEASLRLAFPKAAREALAVSRPETEGKPLIDRLWAQTQELVTIRQGDRVVVGDPVAGVLERARTALDAGDLADATAVVATLHGPPSEAMAGWLAQARSLLQARAALVQWAAAG